MPISQLIATLPWACLPLLIAESQAISAINEFPLENPAAPIMSLEQVRETYAAQHAYVETSGQRGW